MASTPEGRIKDAVKRRLAHYGVLPFMKAADVEGPIAGVYWMPVQGQFAVHGVHDFCGVWDGWFWSMETKAPNNPVDATENQRCFQTAVIKARGISLIGVRSADAVDELARMIEEKSKCRFTD